MHVDPVDDDLAGARAGVVVGAHRERVGARRAHREQIARGKREIAVVREEIRAFADGADDLPAARRVGARPHRLDVVPGIVERRPDEVVHRRVDDREIARVAGLQVQHAGQQHAGVADEKAARLEQQPVVARAARAPHGERVLRSGSIVSSLR